ncbi:MAG: nucleoside deaminase [Verrucomicrobiia bacterium]
MKREFMDEAVRLSLESVRGGTDGPFGAVVVKDNRIVGRGSNQVISTNDPTAHAEIIAIRDACRNLGSCHLCGAEIYTSCEPCPMCLAAIYWAQLERVYYALTRQDAAAMGFDDALIYTELSLPIPKRRLPLHQLARDAALVALREWNDKPDRKLY